MIRNHRPATWRQTAAEAALLLDRMCRPDLARQLSVEPLAESARPGSRSYHLADGPARYSLQLDFSHWLIAVDVGLGEQVVALHVLPPQD